MGTGAAFSSRIWSGILTRAKGEEKIDCRPTGVGLFRGEPDSVGRCSYRTEQVAAYLCPTKQSRPPPLGQIPIPGEVTLGLKYQAALKSGREKERDRPVLLPLSRVSKEIRVSRTLMFVTFTRGDIINKNIQSSVAPHSPETCGYHGG